MDKFNCTQGVAFEIDKLECSLNKFQEKIESMYKESLINFLKFIGNNEHLIESINNKGLPKIILCSEDQYVIWSSIKYLNVKIHTLLEPKSVLFSWVEKVEFTSPRLRI